MILVRLNDVRGFAFQWDFFQKAYGWEVNEKLLKDVAFMIDYQLVTFWEYAEVVNGSSVFFLFKMIF